MSIASEITRLQGVKADILQAIADKGVTVPVGSALDDCPALIASIPTGPGEIPSDYTQVRYLEVIGYDGTITTDPCFRNLNQTMKFSDKVQIDIDFKLSEDFTTGNHVFTFLYIGTITQYFFSNISGVSSSELGQGVRFDYNSNGFVKKWTTIAREFDASISMRLNGTNGEGFVNGEKVTAYGGNDGSASILLLDYQGNSYYYKGTKLYSFKIFDGDTDILKADYVPVIRNSDSRPGLYNRVNGNFYKTGQYSYTPTGVSAGPIVT
jgi:hypothetical protein